MLLAGGNVERGVDIVVVVVVVDDDEEGSPAVDGDSGGDAGFVTIFVVAGTVLTDVVLVVEDVVDGRVIAAGVVSATVVDSVVVGRRVVVRVVVVLGLGGGNMLTIRRALVEVRWRGDVVVMTGGDEGRGRLVDGSGRRGLEEGSRGLVEVDGGRGRGLAGVVTFDLLATVLVRVIRGDVPVTSERDRSCSMRLQLQLLLLLLLLLLLASERVKDERGTGRRCCCTSYNTFSTFYGGG